MEIWPQALKQKRLSYFVSYTYVLRALPCGFCLHDHHCKWPIIILFFFIISSVLSSALRLKGIQNVTNQMKFQPFFYADYGCHVKHAAMARAHFHLAANKNPTLKYENVIYKRQKPNRTFSKITRSEWANAEFRMETKSQT